MPTPKSPQPANPAKQKTDTPAVASTSPTTGGKQAAGPIPRSIDLIADAVSEMLTTGTTEQSLNRLLLAANEHIARRTFERGIGIEDQQQLREYAQLEASRNLQPWREDIVAQWRHHRRETPAAVDPNTVTERIRQNARESLESQMEKFLGSATPEEVRFLSAVLISHEGGAISPTYATNEMALGQAFEYELGRSDAYMRIPAQMFSKVEAYIEALRAIENKAA